MKRFYKAVLVSAAIIVSAACQHSKNIAINLGFGAEEDQRFFVSRTLIDDRQQVPVGAIGCCLGDAGTLSGKIQQLPKTIRLEWRDKSNGRNFMASVKLPTDLQSQAKSLNPYYLRKQQNYQPASPYLVIGIDKRNQMSCWLSNSRAAGSNIEGRQLILLGRVQGRPVSPAKSALLVMEDR